ncbi:MAG: hypothetical protein ACLFR0_07860 [Alphaproteobacteria bacterium]
MSTRKFVFLLAGIILVFAFIGFAKNPHALIFSMPQAQASAHLDSGIKDFTRLQKLYMRRALHSNFDNLIELQGASLQAVIGEPEIVRADFPTVIWQYRSKSCVLDVYFRADNDEAVLFENVIHYEMRHRDHKISGSFEGKEAACMRSLLPSSTAPRLLNVSFIYKSVIN